MASELASWIERVSIWRYSFNRFFSIWTYI